MALKCQKWPYKNKKRRRILIVPKEPFPGYGNAVSHHKRCETKGAFLPHVSRWRLLTSISRSRSFFFSVFIWARSVHKSMAMYSVDRTLGRKILAVNDMAILAKREIAMTSQGRKKRDLRIAIK